MPSSALERVDNISIYTENRFSKEQIFVQLDDLDNMHRLFPDKLINLYGYHIRIGVKRDDFPYIMMWQDHTLFNGILWIMFRDIGITSLNLTFSFTHQSTEHYNADVYYDIIFQREHFQHDFAFPDMGGMCLSCPVKHSKFVVPHFLTPFSLGAWIFLGGVLVVCCILRLLFPFIFRYDPILQTLFGVIGNEYNQAFPARALLFGLSWLSFFFSKVYNSRILALMSLGSFSKRPNTIAEFMQSDYMMVIHKEHLLKFALDDFIPKMLDLEEFERLRGEMGVKYHYNYCSLQLCGEALLLTTVAFRGLYHDFFTIKERVIPYPKTLQFAENSPVVTVISRYLGLFYETGLWDYNFEKHMKFLATKPEPKTVLYGVVFSFDDLMSVWILLGVGLLISTILFVGELLSKKRS
ncbi:uncharacterized protein LOC128712738 [Anopheles marshallii]|uniref:uncharacterized protein LOC128712738 n=1 Tax=Anopheles marshallii TaxID=1521116 RepID=UPI00237AC177|nr:uncharacterized protein LOC128712738 [Anopheles marshallii]